MLLAELAFSPPEQLPRLGISILYIYIYLYLSTYLSIYLSIYIYTYIHIYIYMYVCMLRSPREQLPRQGYTYIYIYAYIYAYIYICIYTIYVSSCVALMPRRLVWAKSLTSSTPSYALCPMPQPEAKEAMPYAFFEVFDFLNAKLCRS
jgi:hypothetical protein